MKRKTFEAPKFNITNTDIILISNSYFDNKDCVLPLSSQFDIKAIN